MERHGGMMRERVIEAQLARPTSPSSSSSICLCPCRSLSRRDDTRDDMQIFPRPPSLA